MFEPPALDPQVISRAFRACGLDLPAISIKTISVHLRANMVETGPFVTTFPRTVVDLYGSRFGLKVLPIEFPDGKWPVKIATLKGRTVSPVVQRFIDCARDIAKPTSGRLKVAARG